MSFGHFLPHTTAKCRQHLDIMDKKKFEEHVVKFMRWSRRNEAWIMKPQERTCEDCGLTAKDRVVTCAAHRLGTDKQYFRHKCGACGWILYDGSQKRNPYNKPTPTVTEKNTVSYRKNKNRSKPIMTPQGEFDSLLSASHHYRRSPGTLSYWMKHRPQEFYYL